MNAQIQVGSKVKFIEGLYADEQGQEYFVIELNGDRCIIEPAFAGLTFPPQSLARTNELEVVED